jgi:hypothetical protein
VRIEAIARSGNPFGRHASHPLRQQPWTDGL